MLRFSEGINLAVHALGYLAAQEGKAATVATIAESLEVSRDHLSKVLQRLSKVRMVSAQRGPKGGYVLAQKSSAITLLDVFEALEGPWHEPHCLLGGNICGGACVLHQLTGEVHQQVREKLDSTTLADLPRLPR
ncbi:MAG: Rrf2 family transcriptional regulator [Deltaproteobacteria bacterium]|nr:Rrf2 family transcriptional regulator [Deltaproteobacteria bacterium]